MVRRGATPNQLNSINDSSNYFTSSSAASEQTTTQNRGEELTTTQQEQNSPDEEGEYVNEQPIVVGTEELSRAMGEASAIP